MRKTLFIAAISLSFCFVYGEDAFLEVFMKNYFNGSSYKVEKHHYPEFDFYFAHNIINDDNDFFSKGILLRINQTEIMPLAYFLENTVFANNEEVFLGVTSKTFYGWKIKFTDKNKSFSTSFYTNDSKNVTEGPIFIWKENKFTKYVVDKSMY